MVADTDNNNLDSDCTGKMLSRQDAADRVGFQDSGFHISDRTHSLDGSFHQPGLSTLRKLHSVGDYVPMITDETGNVQISVLFTDYNIRKIFMFDPDETVFEAKRLVLEAVDGQLSDELNYGLYLPPSGGKAGKFLDEERPLDDYKITGPIGQLEFKYKRRVYRLARVDQRKLKQLHTKANMRQFCDAVKHNNVDKVTKFVEKGMDPNIMDTESGEIPLTLATKVTRCRNLISQLISGGAHLDFRNKRSLTAVHTAALYGNAEAIKALLELGASPNYKDSHLFTPLYHLCMKKNAPALCAELLLRDYAQLGIKDDQGNTELHQACKAGNYRVAELLIFYGAELDYQAKTGATPLHICSANNELSCLQTLLVRGADKTVMNNSRQTPYDLANLTANRDAANILDKHDDLLVVPFEESPSYNTNRRLAGANLEAMRLLSKSDPRINLSSSILNLAVSQSESSAVNGGLENSRQNLGHLGLYDSLSVSRALIRRHHSLKSTRSAFTPPTSVCGRRFICNEDYHSTVAGRLRMYRGDIVTVLSVGDDGMWEGKIEDKEGWFPPEYVSESSKRQTVAGSMSSSQLLRQASMPANQTNWTPPPEIIRTVVLAKTKKGYGFVLRGAKAEQLKKLNMQFVPSERMPALQYLDSVEKGSVSDKAGLNAGDFILEIDNINVTHASHEQTVAIIKKAGDVLQMKVVRSVRVDNEKNKVDNRSNGMMTLPSRKSSAHDVPDAPRVNMKNGHADEEAMAIDHFINGWQKTTGMTLKRLSSASDSEQLDATLANYDSDSRSSSSGTAPAQVSKDLKIASIRQRPSSSHFNSIQELDDMFSENAAENPYSQPFMQLPAEPKQEPVRKPDAGVDLDQLTPPTPISVPPPPSFPPPLPDEHGSNQMNTDNSFRSSFNQPEQKLPRTPLPVSTNTRGSAPPPPKRSFSQDPNIVSTAGSVVTKAIIDTPPPPPPLNQSENTSAFQSSNHNSPAEAPPIPPANAFADAIKQAADNRSKRPVSELPPADKPARDDIYATVNKRPVSTNNINDKPNNAPGVGTGLSVEDQLRLAVAKRRNQIERRGDSSTSESEKSTSVTPERTLSQPAVSSTEPNFRELAEIKRQEWVKRQKDESNNNTTNEKELPPLPPPVIKPPTEEKKSPASDSMSELQKIMNRLAVSSAQTTQQTTQQPEPQPQKKRPPPVFKKPPRQVQKPENLSPLDEFPPPPPLDFAGEMQSGETTSNLDVIVPPPVFDPPTSQFSPNYGSSVSHDTDNHSVSSSVGSDTISSVSQDGNRTSIATSGYHSDSNRSPSAASSATSKLSDKSVESWTVDNVGVWLDSIGLSEYKQVFSENCIEGDTLISMTKQDISELGVNKIGHKVKLDKEIKKLMPEG